MSDPAKWIRFDPQPIPAGYKTGLWWVVAKDGDVLLGEIRWYAPWRRYTFRAGAYGSGFDATCLRDIAAFIEKRMAERKGRATPGT